MSQKVSQSNDIPTKVLKEKYDIFANLTTLVARSVFPNSLMLNN